MSQLQPVVLKDYAAADHTFNPRDIVSGVATLIESTGVPIGDKRLSMSVTRTSTGRSKVLIKFVIPVVQDVVVSGISKPTVVRTSYADLTFTFDPTSSTAERNDVMAYLANLLDSSVGQDVVGDLQSLY